MSEAPEKFLPLERIERQAAAWVLRCDRGLTAAEQDEHSEWLAADPRHGAQLARHRRHWDRLDALAQWLPEHGPQPNPDLLAPPLRTQLRGWLAPAAIGLAAAAAVTLVFFVGKPSVFNGLEPTPSSISSIMSTASRLRVLEDGSTVESNQGAVITVLFSPAERRVRLEQGEAHFAVTKDPTRPFIVNAGGIDVRAVGTAFNVRVDSAAVEVLVTEGRVQVDASVPSPSVEGLSDSTSDSLSVARSSPLVPVLEARQRAVVSRTPRTESPQIATLTAGEIERVLAWQHRLLDFTATPLAELVVEFNRRNRVQLVVLDPELASIRVSASLRSDNVEGFVRLLEAGFGVQSEIHGDLEIVLRRKKPGSE